MNQNKNHWIALYLTGKYPGYFYTPDKLLFIDELQAINPLSFSDEKIKLFGMFGKVNEYEFYLSFLNKLERSFNGQYNDFLDRIKIPKDIIDIFIQPSFNHKKFLEKFNILKSITDVTKKGIAFEDFLKEMFDEFNGLEVVNISNPSDEQIDIILKNNVERPFWISLRSSLLIGEAKNWKAKTNTEVFNTLRGKMDGHKNFCRVGFVIALNGFTSEVEKNSIRDGSGEKIVIPIIGDDISKLLIEEIDPIDWMENIIIKVFK